MTRLSDILPEVYPPLALKLNAKQERFLRHIAQMAGTTPEDIATQFCATQLEFEASLMVDILASPAPDARPGQPDDLQAHEPPLTYGPGKLNLLSAEEIEEAAREHAQIAKND